MRKNIFKNNKGQALLVMVMLSLFLILGLLTSVLLYMFNHHRQKLKEFTSLELFYYVNAGVELAMLDLMLNLKREPEEYEKYLNDLLKEVSHPGMIIYPVIEVYSLGDNLYQIKAYASKTRGEGELVAARRIDVTVRGEDEDEDGRFEKVEVVKWREILPPSNPRDDPK